MASLYTTIPGLVPSSQEIIEAEILAKQVLEGKFPDLDLREGTGLRDLVLRPTAYAFALLKKASDYYFTQNTIKGVDDATPTETVDDILSNWFLTRSLGTYAVLNARVYFARQKNVTITSDLSFSPDNTLNYFPEESKVYPAEAMTYDSYSNEWYIDVFLKAADTGSQYNVSEGSLLYFTNFDPYFLRAEINYLAQESIPTETNAEFIKRASSAISTRNLINIPSVESRIREVFNYVKRIVTVGAGDVDMIRDMIRVMFDDPPKYAPINASVTGNLVTLTLGRDIFIPGQTVELSNGMPVEVNGRYTVVDTGAGTITVEVPSAPALISQAPEVSLAVSPLFIHNAGMTDVYCGDRLSSSIVQVTTDHLGVAKIEGPVYAIERSQASGGDDDDTIPLYKTAQDAAFTTNFASKYLQLSSPAHGFSASDTVEVLGVEQSVSVQSIVCVGLTVTVTADGHGAQVGNTVTISGVTPASYNGNVTVTNVSGNTFQYVVPFQIPSAGFGLSMKVGNTNLLSGAYVHAVPDANTLQVKMPNIWFTGIPSPSLVVGNLLVRKATAFSTRNPFLRPFADVSVTVQNGIATVLLYNHGYTLGREIIVKNSPTSQLNGAWRIVSVASGSEFSFAVPIPAVTPVVTTASVTSVDHRYDYGFSARQILEVDFGIPYANKTASFELKKFSDVEGVQAYLDSPDNRVLCGDYLARGFNLYLLNVSVTAYNGQPPSTELIQSTLDAYLSSLAPGATLVLSEVSKALGVAGIVNIQTPVGVKYTHYTRDLNSPKSGVITDYLDPEDKTSVFVLRSVSSEAENV